MDDREAKQYVIDNVVVTRQKVGIAKRFILDHFEEDAHDLLEAFCRHMEAAPFPKGVVLHENPEPILKDVAERFTWQLAFAEAVWGLIHANLVLPLNEALCGERTTLDCAMPGHRFGIHFPEFGLKYPSRIVRAPSDRCRDEQPLCDADLYLHELNISGLDAPVEQALREAVRCFRHELRLACLAMLGRACEGAWIELGLSLAEVAVKAGYTKAEKTKENLVSPRPGIAQKIDDVVKLYEKQDLFKPISKKSGIRLDDLRNAVIWTDAVRESRNSIHYGAEPAMSNSYEKVAALLIGAIPHLTIVYRLRMAADEAP